MREKMRNIAVPVVAVGASVLSAFPAFAADVDASSLVTTAVTSIQGDMMASISSVTPIAMTLVGAVMAIRFGISFFTKVTGAKK